MGGERGPMCQEFGFEMWGPKGGARRVGPEGWEEGSKISQFFQPQNSFFSSLGVFSLNYGGIWSSAKSVWAKSVWAKSVWAKSAWAKSVWAKSAMTEEPADRCPSVM